MKTRKHEILLAGKGKTRRRYTVMSVPGDRNAPTTWYVYDRQEMRSITSGDDYELVVSLVRKANEEAAG